MIAVAIDEYICIYIYIDSFLSGFEQSTPIRRLNFHRLQS